jgi:hypothetical protein
VWRRGRGRTMQRGAWGYLIAALRICSSLDVSNIPSRALWFAGRRICATNPAVTR